MKPGRIRIQTYSGHVKFVSLSLRVRRRNLIKRLLAACQHLDIWQTRNILLLYAYTFRRVLSLQAATKETHFLTATIARV